MVWCTSCCSLYHVRSMIFSKPFHPENFDEEHQQKASIRCAPAFSRVVDSRFSAHLHTGSRMARPRARFCLSLSTRFVTTDFAIARRYFQAGKLLSGHTTLYQDAGRPWWGEGSVLGSVQNPSAGGTFMPARKITWEKMDELKMKPQPGCVSYTSKAS